MVFSHPRVTNISAGTNCYDGQANFDKHDEYFRILLKQPYEHFFVVETDSFCLSPELPKRFYQEPDVFWTYVHTEERPHKSPYPKIAFQAPWFYSRKTIERLLSVDRSKLQYHPATPYGDWFFMALCCESGVQFRHNLDGVSFMGWNADGNDEVPERARVPSYWRGEDFMEEDVLHGTILIHSVRHLRVINRLKEARRQYLKMQG